MRTALLTSVLLTGVLLYGGGHDIVPAPGGQVVEWGSNLSLNGRATAMERTDIRAVDGNSMWSLALLNDGSLYAWGANNESNQVSSLPSGTDFVDISAGWRHGVAVRSNGTMVEWGMLEWSTGSWVPHRPNPLPSNVVKVAAGDAHTVALLDDGRIAAWGHRASVTNQHLLISNVVDIASGWYHVLIKRTDGTVGVFGSVSQSGQYLQPPAGFKTNEVWKIAARYAHNVILYSNKTVAAWGFNITGQEEVPLDLGPVKSISAQRLVSCALQEDGTLRIWGQGESGENVIPAAATNIYAMGGGGHRYVQIVKNVTAHVEPEPEPVPDVLFQIRGGARW